MLQKQKKRGKGPGYCGMNDIQPPDTRPRPFDEMAPDYDREFTNSVLGRIYRDVVWERIDALFTGKRHILELGCGTGEDALYLARNGHRVTALDASPAMVRKAREKVEQAGVQDLVEFRVMDLESPDLGELGPCKESGNHTSAFDGILANFGVLNCVRDLPSVAGSLHGLVTPGAPGIFVIMGPCVPWEWLWYLRKGLPGKAFRRLRRGGLDWRGVTVRYPRIVKARAAFAPHFRVTRATAIGVFLPPPYAESWAKNNPKIIGMLRRLEQSRAHSPLAARLADHYLLEMERI